MTLINLGYNPKNKNKWKELPLDFSAKEYNGKKVVKFHEKLWTLIKVIIDMKTKGWDSILLIDGRRRSGKSTLAMQIAYLLDPDLSIDNYISGLEDAPLQIEKAKDGAPLIFDEGSLVAGSKDTMSAQSKKLHKIIDVIGAKQLTLIFCMPSFLDISRSIVMNHAMFLIRVGTKKTLARGIFRVYKNKKMKRLYDLSKKDPTLAKKVMYSFNGKFLDFHLPFEKEYFKLKLASMTEAITGKNNRHENTLKPEEIKSKYKTQLIIDFIETVPEVPKTKVAKGFKMSRQELYRRISVTPPHIGL